MVALKHWGVFWSFKNHAGALSSWVEHRLPGHYWVIPERFGTPGWIQLEAGIKAWGSEGSKKTLSRCFNPQTDTEFRMIWGLPCLYPLAIMENDPFQCPYHLIYSQIIWWGISQHPTGLQLPGGAKVCPSLRKSWRVSPTSWLVPRTHPGRAFAVWRLNLLWRFVECIHCGYDHIHDITYNI
jgi:hypothetical protein